MRVKVLDSITRIINAEALACSAPEPRIEHIYHFPRCYTDPGHAASVIESLGAELAEEQVVLARRSW